MERYDILVKNLILPIVTKEEQLEVTVVSDIDGYVVVQVYVAEEDLGRVIGKKGRVANSIRTIAYVGAAKMGKKIRIDIDAR